MLYFFLVLLGAVGLATYLLVIYREVPGAVEERLGTLDALPDHVGKWQNDETSDAGKAALARGEQRETRLWHEPSGGLFGGEKLCEQVRYRSIGTGSIVRSDADRPFKRRRRPADQRI